MIYTSTRTVVVVVWCRGVRRELTRQWLAKCRSFFKRATTSNGNSTTIYVVERLFLCTTVVLIDQQLAVNKMYLFL